MVSAVNTNLKRQARDIEDTTIVSINKRIYRIASLLPPNQLSTCSLLFKIAILGKTDCQVLFLAGLQWVTLRVWILSVLCLDERLLLHRDGFCRTGQVARSGTDYGGKKMILQKPKLCRLT